jgi:translation initiation factor IF-3
MEWNLLIPRNANPICVPLAYSFYKFLETKAQAWKNKKEPVVDEKKIYCKNCRFFGTFLIFSGLY